jgi:hypothetical protein
VQIDAVGAVLDNSAGANSSHIAESGVVGNAQWDTTSYGAWSLNLAQETGGSGNYGSPLRDVSGRGAIELQNRQLPFDNGWSADTAAGDILSPNISLLQRGTRLYLPNPAIAGLSTAWQNPLGTQLFASVGEPEIEQGLLVPRVQTLGGTLASVGAQTSPAPHWTIGGEILDASGILPVIPQTTLTGTGVVVPAAYRVSTTTALVSAVWQGATTRSQLSLLDGHTANSPNGSGVWWDVTYGTPRFTQNAGVMRIDPDISWGNQIMINDVEGGYYHVGYRRAQWQVDAGLDEVRSVSGLTPRSTFGSLDGIFHPSHDVSIGGSANIREAVGATAYSTSVYVEELNSLGATRLQADTALDSTVRNSYLGVDQQWETDEGTHLNSSFGVERLETSGVPAYSATALAVAIYGGGGFGRLTLDANARVSRGIQGSSVPLVEANITAAWRLTANWSFRANLYDSRQGSWRPVTVTSPLTPPGTLVIPPADARGIFLTVRYQHAQGSHFAPLEGRPGTGWGELTGVVFLDANDNDRMDAGESGAANVTVVLDGRFSVRTDANGRFEFGAVANGRHTVTVVIDNLPLPWVLARGERFEATVSTRQTTELMIAAKRAK